MIIATAGHVDHGKTSLVNALTGVDTDRLAEEKARGLTIDLGFAYTDGDSGRRLGFVDVPGHIRFINNMLAGVAAIDHALLVIAADDGVMPQTVEHLEILNLLGIANGTIAITKIDRVDTTQLERTLQEVSELVSTTFLAGAEVIPVSAVSGEGIELLQLALDMAANDLEQRRPAGHFRLAIDRRFTIKGSGIVVTGSIFAGTVREGDELLLMPGGLPARVRGLRTQDQASQTATAGDRCAVNIAGSQLDLAHIHRGNWLTSNPAAASDRADARLRVLAAESRALRHWTPVHIHTGANHVTGRVAVLEQPTISPGSEGLVQLVLDQPIVVCTGDRFVIRDQGANRTIGGGRIIDPRSPRRGRASPERLTYLQAVHPDDARTTLQHLLATAQTGIALASFAQRFNLKPDELDALVRASDALMIGDDLAISPGSYDARAEEVLSLMDQWHQQNPAKAGLPLNQLQAMRRNWSSELLEALVDALVADQRMERAGNLFNLPGAGIQLSRKEQAVFEAALPLLASDPLKPPVLHDLAGKLGENPKDLEKILAQVVKTGQLVRPVKNRFFVPAAIDELKAKLHEAAGQAGQFSVQQYRDATGIGRNLSIEILEYFDRQGVTRRVGDVRQITD